MMWEWMGVGEADQCGVGGSEELGRTKKPVNQSATPLLGILCGNLCVNFVENLLKLARVIQKMQNS